MHHGDCPLQTFPFFGVVPAILNESGVELEGEAEGYLVKNGGCCARTKPCRSYTRAMVKLGPIKWLAGTHWEQESPCALGPSQGPSLV